ncbi:DUF2254 family protein [Methanobacterium spitsbergense]|uniref:DUF2254 domain-containing protein n=1 Tax=Methanobacterium spitsbergense TaxID=2874285 RepID=A0A8T5UTF7_9EURY|nr:DUF2254 family protein [Methanobacterium spitsbergense]MBZ2164500.1 DUF2254 domain-containing protein [Methanobacterium spitsbergense]
MNFTEKFSFMDKKYVISLTLVIISVNLILDLFLYVFFKIPTKFSSIIILIILAFCLSILANYGSFLLISNFDRATKFYKSKFFHIFVLLTPIYLTIVFISYGININDVDSARYMISSIIQSEAAIIAIVISLSLVAIQLASSSYSVRIIDIFKESKSLWILIFSYIIAIIYGLIILGLINRNNIQYYEDQIIIIYYLAIFAFGALIPYIIEVIDLLQPSTVIKKLSSHINDKNIIEAIRTESETEDIEFYPEFSFLNSFEVNQIKPIIQSDKEPIQPIIDIIRSSIILNDVKTFKDGLMAIHRVDIILEDNKLESKDKEEILKLLLTYLGRIGRLLIDNGDEETLYDLIFHLRYYGNKSKQKSFYQALILVINTLGTLGKIALNGNHENVASFCVHSINILFDDIKDEKFSQNIQNLSLNYYKNIGRYAIKKEFDDTAFAVAYSLQNLSRTQNKFTELKIEIINFLGELGIFSTESRLEYASITSTRSLLEIAKDVTIDNRSEFSEIISYFLEIGNRSINERLKMPAASSVISLQNSSELAIIEGFELEAIRIGKFNVKLAEKAINNKFEVLYDIPRIVKEIIKFAIINHYDRLETINTVQNIIGSLANYDVKDIRKGLENYKKYNSIRVINKLINSLGDLGELIAYDNPYCQTSRIIEHFTEINELGSKLEISHSVVSNLSKIGKIASEKNAKENVVRIIDSIIVIINESINNKSNIGMYDLQNVTIIAKNAMKSEFENYNGSNKGYVKIYENVIESLIDFSKEMINEKNNNIFLFGFSLGDIGKNAAQYRNLEVLRIILDSIQFIGKNSAELGLFNGVNSASYSFAIIGKEATDQGFEKISEECINFFRENTKTIVDTENYLALKWAVNSLGEIGKISTKKKFIELSNMCIEYSGQLGKYLIGKIICNNNINKESIEEMHNLFNLLDFMIVISKQAYQSSDLETASKIDIALSELAEYSNANSLNILEKRIQKYVQEFRGIK